MLNLNVYILPMFSFVAILSPNLECHASSFQGLGSLRALSVLRYVSRHCLLGASLAGNRCVRDRDHHFLSPRQVTLIHSDLGLSGSRP